MEMSHWSVLGQSCSSLLEWLGQGGWGEHTGDSASSEKEEGFPASLDSAHSAAGALCLQTRCWRKVSARPECAAGRWVQVLSVQLPEGTRCARASRGLGLFCLSGLGSFCLRIPEHQGGPGSGALSRVGVCTHPPNPLGAGAPAPLPAPGLGPPPRLCHGGAGGGELPGGTSGHGPSPRPPARRSPPAPAPQPGSRPPPRAPGPPARALLPEPSPQLRARAPGSRPQPGPASRAALRPAGPAQAPTPGEPCSPAR